MRQITVEQAANEVRRAYQTYVTQHPRGIMPIREVGNRTDLTHREITGALLHLSRTDPHFIAIPESNQKTLTTADRDARVRIGNQWKDLIVWKV